MKSKRELHNTHQLNKGQEKKREGNDRQHGLFDLRIPLMMLRERLSSQLRHLLIVSCFEDRNDLTIYHQSSRLSALLSSLGNTCWNKFITRFITRTSSSSRGFLSCLSTISSRGSLSTQTFRWTTNISKQVNKAFWQNRFTPITNSLWGQNTEIVFCLWLFIVVFFGQIAKSLCLRCDYEKENNPNSMIDTYAL